MDERPDERELLDELAEEFTRKLRQGEHPDASEVAAAHPEMAEEIERLLAVIEIMESAPLGTDAAKPVSFPGLEIIEEIAPGVGGMGQVFRARELNLDRVVAVKTIRGSLPTASARAWFEKEAKAAAALDHPNIVGILSFSPDHDPPFFVMQLVEGQRLDEACRGRTPQQIAELFAKVARALAYAHDRGIVHRDLKPANILVDTRGEPLIADFGLARRGEAVPAGGEVDVSSFAGTPAFIAPEVFRDAEATGPAADVYALGVSLYTVLCGRLPFTGTTLEALRQEVREGRPPLPRELRPEISEALQRITLAAIEPDPRDRLDSAAMLADELERFRAGREVLSRPRRFERELRGRLEHHLSDVRLWRESRLLHQGEADALSRPYERLLGQEAPWQEFVRRFPVETIMLRIGGALLVLSSALWPAFYWPRLSGDQRLAATAIPALLLTALGWIEVRRRVRTNAVALLFAGAVLLPLAMTVMLTEYGVGESLQPAAEELFPPPQESALDDAAGEPFAPTNFQLLLATAAFWIHALVLLASVRARSFVWLLGAGTWLLTATLYLKLGLKEWLTTDRVSLVLLLLLPIALLFAVLPRMLRHRARERWSSSFYLFFPLPFVAILTAIAYWGAKEWVVADPKAELSFNDEAVQRWLMANGLVHAAVATLSIRSRVSWARHWAAFFLTLVPISVLVPANTLFEEGRRLFDLGGAGFTEYEAVALVAAFVFVAIGTRLNRLSLIAPGMIGLGVFVLRATARHFREQLSWPLIVGVAGALAMFGGAALAGWRLARRQKSG